MPAEAVVNPSGTCLRGDSRHSRRLTAPLLGLLLVLAGLLPLLPVEAARMPPVLSGDGTIVDVLRDRGGHVWLLDGSGTLSLFDPHWVPVGLPGDAPILPGADRIWEHPREGLVVLASDGRALWWRADGSTASVPCPLSWPTPGRWVSKAQRRYWLGDDGTAIGLGERGFETILPRAVLGGMKVMGALPLGAGRTLAMLSNGAVAFQQGRGWRATSVFPPPPVVVGADGDGRPLLLASNTVYYWERGRLAQGQEILAPDGAEYAFDGRGDLWFAAGTTVGRAWSAGGRDSVSLRLGAAVRRLLPLEDGVAAVLDRGAVVLDDAWFQPRPPIHHECYAAAWGIIGSGTVLDPTTVIYSETATRASLVASTPEAVVPVTVDEPPAGMAIASAGTKVSARRRSLVTLLTLPRLLRPGFQYLAVYPLQNQSHWIVADWLPPPLGTETSHLLVCTPGPGLVALMGGWCPGTPTARLHALSTPAGASAPPPGVTVTMPVDVDELPGLVATAGLVTVAAATGSAAWRQDWRLLPDYDLGGGVFVGGATEGAPLRRWRIGPSPAATRAWRRGGEVPTDAVSGSALAVGGLAFGPGPERCDHLPRVVPQGEGSDADAAVAWQLTREDPDLVREWEAENAGLIALQIMPASAARSVPPRGLLPLAPDLFLGACREPIGEVLFIKDIGGDTIARWALSAVMISSSTVALGMSGRRGLQAELSRYEDWLLFEGIRPAAWQMNIIPLAVGPNDGVGGIVPPMFSMPDPEPPSATAAASLTVSLASASAALSAALAPKPQLAAKKPDRRRPQRRHVPRRARRR